MEWPSTAHDRTRRAITHAGGAAALVFLWIASPASGLVALGLAALALAAAVFRGPPLWPRAIPVVRVKSDGPR